MNLKLTKRFSKAKSRFSRLIKAKTKALASLSLLDIFTILHTQIRLRPRVRLLSIITIGLILAFIGANSLVNYLKPKESEIKINGRTMVAQKADDGESLEELEISQSLISKRSPFDFRRPVEGGYLSQRYSAYHRANDIATAFGSSIHPLGSGTVEFTGAIKGGKGNVVVVNHGDGLKSLYAHMGKIYVGTGDGVTSETVIGTVGLTGRTTGAHVHLEIVDNDIMVDPTSMLPQ